jgi:OmpA-OmpF porin, OOP family
MKIPAAVVSLITLCVTTPPQTLANEVGFYTGGYIGRSEKESDRAEFEALRSNIHAFFDYTPTTFESSFDEADTTFAIFLGYRFNRYLAIEGGYADLGEVSYSSTSSGTFPNDVGFLNANIESETAGFQLSLLGVLPLSHNWELFARVGSLFATNTLKVALNAQGETFVQAGEISDSFNQTSTDTFAGIGLSRRFFDIYDVRLEYQRFFNAGNSATGVIGDLDAALLGLTVTF